MIHESRDITLLCAVFALLVAVIVPVSAQVTYLPAEQTAGSQMVGAMMSAVSTSGEFTGVPVQNAPYETTMIIEDSGSGVVIKDGKTGRIVETLTRSELEKRKADAERNMRIEGPDASGKTTFYDRETGVLLGYGYGQKA